MAEAKLAAIKYDVMQESRDIRTKIITGTTSQPAAAVSFPSNQLKTVWDLALDEITATVFAELRF